LLAEDEIFLPDRAAELTRNSKRYLIN